MNYFLKGARNTWGYKIFWLYFWFLFGKSFSMIYLTLKFLIGIKHCLFEKNLYLNSKFFLPQCETEKMAPSNQIIKGMQQIPKSDSFFFVFFCITIQTHFIILFQYFLQSIYFSLPFFTIKLEHNSWGLYSFLPILLWGWFEVLEKRK